jgi:chromosome segregation ATPase
MILDTKKLEAFFDPIKDLVDQDKQYLEGLISKLVDRIDGLQASVENLEEYDAKKDRQISNLGKGLSDLEDIHEDCGESALTARLDKLEGQVGELLKEDEDEYNDYFSQGIAPEPESRHGISWSTAEDHFLAEAFQNFLKRMAVMTGRKPAAIFYRVKDKILPQRGVIK